MTKRRDDGAGAARWIVTGISVAVVAALVALLIYFEIAARYERPPDLRIERAGEIRVSGAAWYVPFELRNEGGQAAEHIEVEGVLTVRGEPTRRAPQRFDYLPGHDRARGELVFDVDPARGTLELRVLSLQRP